MCSRSRDRRGAGLARSLTVLAFVALAGACGRESTVAPRQVPPGGDRMEGVRQVPLRPGMPVSTAPARSNPLGSGEHVVREGQRLYQWMNCIGCHFEGGGGMGPPLIDAEWIYGREPAQIFDTIVNGRPNGMPAYGDKLVAEEIWRIVAYVETLAARAEEDAEKGGAGRGR